MQWPLRTWKPNNRASRFLNESQISPKWPSSSTQTEIQSQAQKNGSNTHTEGSRTSVNTTLKGTRIAMWSWPAPGFVSSYGTDHRGVAYSIIFMTLLRPRAYLAVPVSMVAHRAHSCVRDCHLLLYSNSLHSTFWHHESWSGPSGFPHTLWPQCVRYLGNQDLLHFLLLP